MIVQIEVNTRCNFKCWFCQNAHYEPTPNDVMPLSDFEAILRKLKAHYGESLPLISFAAYNEPTLDPFFKERLRLMTNLGFTYWWLSNGSLMSEDLIDFLIEEKPRITNLSLNLCSSEPEALARMVEITPSAATRYLSTLRSALERLQEPDLTVGIKVHGDGSEEHQKSYDAMKEWVQPLSVSVTKVGVMNRAGMLQGVGRSVHHSKDAALVCTTNYLSNIYIGVKGEVYLCCHDYYKTTAYANILTDDIATLMRHPDRSASLKILQEQFCKQCEFALDVRRHPAQALTFFIRPYYRLLPLGFRRRVTSLRHAVRTFLTKVVRT
jgi:radical SAM protein with 4Fe4S-binding SPASM domain